MASCFKLPFLLCSLPKVLLTAERLPRTFLHLSFRVSLTALPQEGTGMGCEGAALVLGILHNQVVKRLHL